MRVLVFGGWGQLGSDLAVAAEGRHTFQRPPHSEVDVTDPLAVLEAVMEARPDAVVDAAAFHKVELCEEDPGRSFAVNATGARNVARASRRAGARCVYVSSDYVFDGEAPEGNQEEDPPAPLNVYGVSKAAGERLVRLACPDSLVARGSGLFGHAGSSGKGGNFVENMLVKAAAGESITVVDDQFFSPTATRDMAERIFLLLERGVPSGIYHVANAGSCSWFQFAARIFDLAGVTADLSPRPAGEQAVRRPRSSILIDTRSAALGLPPNRSWEDALRWYLAARPTAAPILPGARGAAG
ncbi:MAG: dTDP-4-dehydrorhamnose reductase [Actinobacteria bacterium]|nr:MAG: dTDP-4-dehydrorhamnose reductase [Actinomycetota bacterium]